MTAEEMLESFKEVGVPALVPGWMAADLAEGLGLPWIRKNRETWLYTNLAQDFARRMKSKG